MPNYCDHGLELCNHDQACTQRCPLCGLPVHAKLNAAQEWQANIVVMYAATMPETYTPPTPQMQPVPYIVPQAIDLDVLAAEVTKRIIAKLSPTIVDIIEKEIDRQIKAMRLPRKRR